MKRFALASLVVTFLLTTSDAALGCVCVELSERPSPEQARAMLAKDFSKAFAVFSGEVIELDTYKVKFKVYKLWKGDFEGEITMLTGTKKIDETYFRSSSCDYSFKLGEKYLVYAYGASPDEMQAHECTRTRLLKYAKQEIESLNDTWPHKQMNPEPGNELEDEPQPAAKSNKFREGQVIAFAFPRLAAWATSINPCPLSMTFAGTSL